MQRESPSNCGVLLPQPFYDKALTAETGMRLDDYDPGDDIRDLGRGGGGFGGGGGGMGGLLVGLLPMLLVFIGAQGYFVQSVASQGLKG